MTVLNTGERIELSASFEETAAMIEGLRKAAAAYEEAENWRQADELRKYVEELLHPEIKLDY